MFRARYQHAKETEHSNTMHGMDLLKALNKRPLVTLSQKGSENTIASM